MNPIENSKTNSVFPPNKEEGFILPDRNVYRVKENSASSDDDKKYINQNIVNTFQDTTNEKKAKLKLNDLLKRRVLSMLKKENINVGFTSMTELYLNEILEKDLYQVKEILNLIHIEIFDNPEELQKFIEVMSNLDYEKIYPTNTIMAVGIINHADIGVQEAAIAAFEKWDDKRNVKLLKNIKYTAEWIENYAEKVINYLESC